jgi:L-ascorbate metabolism protein UlaG (beta-lactamase superfamily)
VCDADAAAVASGQALVLTSTVFVRGKRMDAFHTGPVGQWVLGDAEPAVRAAHRELLHGATCTSALFEPVGPGEYALRDELYAQPTPSILDGEPRVELVDRVRRCCVKLPLDEAALRTLNETLPRMNRGTRVETLRATLSTDGWNLVENLVATGMATAAPYRAPGPRRGSRVTLVGHSCLLVETPSTRVLADPLLTVRGRPDYDRWDVLDEPLDGIVISHAHWDHFNLDTLIRIDRRAAVVLPRRQAPASIVNLDMAQVVRELGFTDVRELLPWESTRIGDVEITAAPYHGEGTGRLSPRDWMTYRIAADGRALFCVVDGCRDPFGDMDDVVGAMARRGPIDMLFVPASGYEYPTNHYAERPLRITGEREQYTGGVPDVLRWAALSGAELVIPYAMFHCTPGDEERDELEVATDPERHGSLTALRGAMPHHPAGALAVLQPGGRVEWVRGSPLEVRCTEPASGAPGPRGRPALCGPTHHAVTEAST